MITQNNLQAKIVQNQDTIQLHIAGEHVKHVDGKLLESCLNVLLRCAETNGCLDQGMKLSHKCIEAIASHNQACGCVAKGFGLGVEQEASSTLRASFVQDSVQIHITGERARQIDGKMLESCLNAIFACGCLSPGGHFTARCIETLASHNQACGCLPKGFGLNQALARV
jgi:hypothetical protein